VLANFKARFLAKGPFSRAIFGTISVSDAVPATISFDGGNNRRNFGFEMRFRSDLASKLKNARGPKPLPCRPSSVETPVCGLIRRTPLGG
jgi:hypothetical protein